MRLVDPDGRMPIIPLPLGWNWGIKAWNAIASSWKNYRSTASGMKNAFKITTGNNPSFMQRAAIELTAATLHYGDFTSQNDVSVLKTGQNMGGTSASGFDKALAVAFITLPMSGGAVKKLSREGVELLGKFVKKFTNQAFHLDEVQNALGGLGKQLNSLNKSIDAGSFSGEALNSAQNLRSILQKQKGNITDVLNCA